MFTCSIEAQSGGDSLQSVTVSWSHQGQEVAHGGKYAISSNTTTTGTKGYLKVVSTMVINSLVMEDSGSIQCSVAIAAISAQNRNHEVIYLRSTASLLVISKSESTQRRRNVNSLSPSPLGR